MLGVGKKLLEEIRPINPVDLIWKTIKSYESRPGKCYAKKEQGVSHQVQRFNCLSPSNESDL